MALLGSKLEGDYVASFADLGMVEDFVGRVQEDVVKLEKAVTKLEKCMRASDKRC